MKRENLTTVQRQYKMSNSKNVSLSINL